MYKSMMSAVIMVFILAIFSANVIAEVSHVSINSRQFELNEQPKLKLNLIAKKVEITDLAFHIKHIEAGEPVTQVLVLHSINDYLLQVIGTQVVTDPKATLLVLQLKEGQWLMLDELSIFDSPYSLNKTDFAHPVAPASALQRQSIQNVASSKTKVVNQPPVSKTEVSSNNQPTSPQMMPKVPDNCVIKKSSTDTLWKIASRYAEAWNTNVYGAMLAIFEANMLAFSNQRIHILKAEATLVCPSQAVLAEYADKKTDKKVFEIIEAKHKAR